MTATQTETITGDEIFFNFIELHASDLPYAGDLVSKLQSGEVHGFVVKNLLSAEEVQNVLSTLKKYMDANAMPTPSGRIFPCPFAVISDSGERLDTYYNSLAVLHDIVAKDPAMRLVQQRVDAFFKAVAADFEVSIPINKVKGLPVCEGTYREFPKDKGGLFVHCGHLFQQQTQKYYELLANDIDMADQLSFFLKLQDSEEGGELTIYDMLWKDVVGKATPDENNSVIDAQGNTIYLKDVRQFKVMPLPGDILVFSGGPIWHRVEDIKGETSRITYGGFVNYSQNGKELFYWA